MNYTKNLKQLFFISSLLVFNTTYANSLFEKFEIEVNTQKFEPQKFDLLSNIIQQQSLEQHHKGNLIENQYFFVVDANFNNQYGLIGFWDNELKKSTISNHYSLISSGKTGSKQHFITPTGWFETKIEFGSYRAEGTKNSNGILGLGSKGKRVWDLGWQDAQAGWTNSQDIRKIRFQIHATDPYVLEKKLGTPASKGCIRVSSTMNDFLDKYGILDKNFNTQRPDYFALKKDREITPQNGKFLLVVNTAN